ncbi:DUF1192 domain-containing protein [Asticcacaulis sp. YBE204]|uniref:DUF1192 domain-containing protein n=1 Tax=Asticcacaulis sp. YBE204 TaxID=1282363 RepID=UPI0003C3D32C|nr:DUF1192 domain-containing protein [Asticcacaulis sp. YBE204]ESQ79958.1 hypothetical protein AEYBE204_08915 [Asticcacaulis sp. YBE204]
MSEDETVPAFKTGSAPASALFALVHEDLSDYAVTDLKERIKALEDEIVRAKAMVERKQSGRSAADALFSFKGN